MFLFLLPPIWLIVLLVGLPQLSETVYSPSLPEIARALLTSHSMVEYTLTIYLFSFSIATLFWGFLSDRLGRKNCVLAGLIIFSLGCIGCYFSTTIYQLLFSRFIQGFGGSVGSVLGQVICRDAYSGDALGKVYSSIGSALAYFPAIGPVVGGFLAQWYGWSNIFLFLLAFTFILIMFVFLFLPETLHADDRKSFSIFSVAKKLACDGKVIGFGLIVAACNGISFSYFAEAPFFFIKKLGLSSSLYGLTFIGIAGGSMIGGLISRKLHNNYSSDKILGFGLKIITLASLSFCGCFLFNAVFMLPVSLLILLALSAQVVIMLGVCMVTSNALALALVDYKWCSGTASSIFGSFYYLIISGFTLGMGLLHNGTLLLMPTYFLGLSLFMFGVYKILVEER